MRKLLLFCLLLCSSAALAQGLNTTPLTAVDGDTVKQGGLRYRLLGFDTPETLFAKCPAEKELGLKAKARLVDLLTSKNYVLEPTGKLDKYRRGLANLSFEGRSVRDIMLEENLAVPYSGRTKRINWCAKLNGATP